MKDLRATRGRQHILDLIAEGEHETQDFKFAISDARKIARSLSAFANNRGGHLLVGVKDNGVIAGLRDEGDIYLIEYAASRYCSPAVDVEFHAYKVGDGLTVLKASVGAAPARPVCVDEGDGRMVAYIRVADNNIVAPALMLAAWRCRSDDSPILTLNSFSKAVLNVVADSPDGIDTDSLCRALLLSHATVTAIAAGLIASGLLTLRYHRDHWLLHPAP